MGAPYHHGAREKDFIFNNVSAAMACCATLSADPPPSASDVQ
jgi:hypothetical protein